jgi:hypothetical protein
MRIVDSRSQQRLLLQRNQFLKDANRPGLEAMRYIANFMSIPSFFKAEESR